MAHLAFRPHLGQPRRAAGLDDLAPAGCVLLPRGSTRQCASAAYPLSVLVRGADKLTSADAYLLSARHQRRSGAMEVGRRSAATPEPTSGPQLNTKFQACSSWKAKK